MNRLNYLAVFLLLIYKPVFAASLLICQAEQFQLSGIKVTAKYSQELKKSSISFTENDNFWHVTAYEFDKQEDLYLLAGVKALTEHQAIITQMLSNYKNRLEQEFLYKTEILSTFPVSISGLAGTGYMLNATYSDPMANSPVIASPERFALWAIVKNNKILYGELHISINGAVPSIALTNKRLTAFIDTCSIA